ncbi:hypothetical protein GGR26_002334 [Lewinella marina]|uniref:DUF3616 domain-containing protein n=1 Tax=Neolewinella marina TaxID=438751 RepID=A0A2G0CG85_9BACT|nr:DUF3616 domain-containing protein [Neolewinella marina]NJB86566.1 hypothetical protein [Neolewinella marina]PHK98982.1 hypothetical protein CGL56_05840 [Neolewinella marina]
MKMKRRDPIRQVRLTFNHRAANIEEIRGQLSTSVVVDQTLFVAYDESSAIERLLEEEGGYGNHETYELADFFDLPDGSEGEMDIEGLAWEEPYLWFTGSMSLKRATPDEDDDDQTGAAALGTITVDRNRFSLGRIPCRVNRKTGTWTPLHQVTIDGKKHTAKLLEGGSDSTVLTELLSTDAHLSPFMHIPCKDNGFDIEGLAVHHGRIFIGLRGPVIGGWAVVLEFGVHERGDFLHLDGRGHHDKPYRKHFVKLAGMGIREINIDPRTGDVLLLAGPTMDLDGTISAWCIRGGFPEKEVTVCHHPERLYDVTHGGQHAYGKDKAEGMAILADGTHLVIYDSPLPERLVGEGAVLGDVFHP